MSVIVLVAGVGLHLPDLVSESSKVSGYCIG